MKKIIIKIACAFAIITFICSCSSPKSGCYDFSMEAIEELDNTHNEVRTIQKEYCLD